MRLGVDAITASAQLGAEKPSALFFAQLAQLCGLPPREIAYVGDRVDNDIVPVKTTGMAAIFLVRGPWGRVHASQANANMADVRIAESCGRAGGDCEDRRPLSFLVLVVMSQMSATRPANGSTR